MTIPAIAPPERPLWLPLAAPAAPVAVDDAPLPVGEALPVGEELPLEVEVNKLGMVENTGRVTSVHRPVVLDVTQQESVAFSELPRQ